MPFAEFTLERDGATTPVWHRVGDGSQWVLLLHGSGMDHRSMEVLLAGLPAHADVLLPDLRGQGEAVLAPGVHAFFDDIVADCVALLDRVSATSVTVIGHSYGSHVAQELAWMLPERVDRLVLIGCHDQHRHRTVGERTRVAAVSALARVMSWERFARLSAQVGGDDVELRDSIEQGHLRCGRDVFLDLGQSASRSLHTVDGYAQPILLLAGEREYSRAFDRRYARIASRTHAVGIQVVEDAGHMCHQEQPAEVTEAIAEFLAR